MASFLLKVWGAFPLTTKLKLFFMRRFNDQFLIGVTGIFLNDKDEVMLFKHTYRDKEQWSLPGGYLKAKEHPKEGLEREILEESGLVVSADYNLKLRTDRKTARFDITYVGKFIGGEFTPSNEVSAVKFFTFDKLPNVPHDQLLFIEKALNKNHS